MLNFSCSSKWTYQIHVRGTRLHFRQLLDLYLFTVRFCTYFLILFALLLVRMNVCFVCSLQLYDFPIISRRKVPIDIMLSLMMLEHCSCPY
jgi:hypothetical protein